MTRISEYPIHPLLLERWSPRSMTEELLEDKDFLPLFEAARWAPSASNEQPWRFLYAKRTTPGWEKLFSLLIPFNQEWCIRAAILGMISAKKTTKRHQTNPTAAFDTGAAWQNLCLEGFHRGLVVHGMRGFDVEKAQYLAPEDQEVIAFFAIGKKGPKDLLPLELQKRETPSQRDPLSSFIQHL